MTINLDVLMYLARIALCVAGVIAVIYLVLLFKSVITTMTELQETLKAVNRDLVKLESPLDTIGQVSNTVDEVQASAKKAAMGAIHVFSQGTEKLGGMISKNKNSAQPAAQVAENDLDAMKADFQKITKDLNQIARDEKIQDQPENNASNNKDAH